MSEGNVVGLDAFRAARVARELERHFGLPEGAAEVSPDFWAQRHSLIDFAKTGGPTIPPAEIRSWRDGILNVVPSPHPRD